MAFENMLLFILAVVIFLFSVTSLYAGFRAALWVPTRRSDIERVSRLTSASPGQKFYDLGCGDGRLLCVMAGLGLEATGFEISLPLFLAARIRRLFQKDKKRIKILYRDFWRTNLNEADIVYLFLTPQTFPKLEKKFKNELKKGTKVITYVWPFKCWQPIKTDIQKGRRSFYLYER